MRTVDVTARVEADGVSIKLPRLTVKVEQRQAERLRDVLNTVLPCACTEVDHVRRHLLSIAGDIEPELSGAYDSEAERLEAAQDYRRAHGDEDGLFRVDVDATGTVTVDTFSGRELEMPRPPLRGCSLCNCSAVGEVCGLPVCTYHTDHTEDDPRCPDCVPVHTGDRVQDPMDGTWRTVARLDLAENTAHMADGGCMSIDEAGRCEKRLPSESLPQPCPACEAWADGGRILTEDEWHAAGNTICDKCRFSGRTAGMHS